ncbi:MAG: hypothetical protein PW845_22555 [Pseudomonas sp.]|uniref:hypothetical protein n=1 Tax=Pseudomonas abieticivorans TaxID=2931382 RepID=UPI0020BF689A|nr:hypothetical protein [Pseudomonas sp. PIA16]MDE1168088.1 hypothetical protein [Pseudomonas sp.]
MTQDTTAASRPLERFFTRIPTALRIALDHQARRNSRSLNGEATQALASYLEGHRKLRFLSQVLGERAGANGRVELLEFDEHDQVHVLFRLPAELRDQVNQIALASGSPMRQVFSQACRGWVSYQQHIEAQLQCHASLSATPDPA